MAEATAEIQAPTETGPEAPKTTPANPEPQPQQETSKHQPDSGVPADIINVPDEPNNVQKIETDGNLASSIDGKIPDGLNSKEEWLHTLLEKEKKAPGLDYSEDELDILDEYYEGRIKPTEPKAKEEKPQDSDTVEKTDDAENSNNEDNSIEAVLKEVGAKSQNELLKKVKDLRKIVSGKVKGSAEYQELKSQSGEITKRFQNELNLMEDVRAGVPEAISHLENAYGVKIHKPGKQKQQVESEDVEGNTDVSDEFLDEVAGKKISGLEKQIAKLTEKLETVAGSNDKIQEKFAGERAEAQIVDEMVQVAEMVPVLKEIKNLRGAVKSWREGKNDPRLDGFAHLFETANEKGVDLITAHEILAGRNASLEIARAKRSAKEEVYTQKPNRSLSDLQGRGVDNKPSYSDDQLQCSRERKTH